MYRLRVPSTLARTRERKGQRKLTGTQEKKYTTGKAPYSPSHPASDICRDEKKNVFHFIRIADKQ